MKIGNWTIELMGKHVRVTNRTDQLEKVLYALMSRRGRAQA